MKWVGGLAMAVAIAACSPMEGARGTAKVFYLPIGVATFVPVTRERIGVNPACYAELDIGDRRFTQIMAVIATAGEGAPFGEAHVRVKILLPNTKVVYVDNYGAVINDGEDRALSNNNLRKLKRLLDSVTRRFGSDLPCP